MTRDEILDAAAQIFREKGFHGASMQEIAHAVNLQKASLYYHISSKQDILLALLDRALDTLIEHFENEVDQQLAPTERLRQAMRVYLQAMLDNRDLAAVLLLEHRSLEPHYHASHIPRRDRFESLWRELIEDGRRKQVFNCSDPALSAKALLGAMNWIITWYRPDGKLTAEQIADQYANLFLSGLIARTE